MTQLEYEYKQAKNLMNKIIEVLNKEVKSEQEASDSPTNFDKASWAYEQAYRAGVRNTLKNLIKLFNR